MSCIDKCLVYYNTRVHKSSKKEILFYSTFGGCFRAGADIERTVKKIILFFS